MSGHGSLSIIDPVVILDDLYATEHLFAGKTRVQVSLLQTPENTPHSLTVTDSEVLTPYPHLTYSLQT